MALARPKLRNVPFITNLLVVYLFLWGPTFLVIYISFGESGSTTLPVTEFSLRWFEELAADSEMIRALKNSIGVSVASAAPKGQLYASRNWLAMIREIMNPS